MSKTDKLTPRQRAFCDEYLVDLNATQAAIRAGYSQKGAHVRGSELLANHKVARAIAGKFEDRMKRVEVDQDYVLGVLKENIERAMQRRPVLNNKGKETGNYVYDGRTVNGAASLLGKHLGMFTNRILYQGVTRFRGITGIVGTPGSEIDQSADRPRLTP